MVGDKNKTHCLHKSTLFSGHVSVYTSCHLVVLKCAVRNIQLPPKTLISVWIAYRKRRERKKKSQTIFFSFDKITKYKMIN